MGKLELRQVDRECWTVNGSLMGEGIAGCGTPPPKKKQTTDIHPDLRAPEEPWKVAGGTRRGRRSQHKAQGVGGRVCVRQTDGAGRHSEDRKRCGGGSLGKDRQTDREIRARVGQGGWNEGKGEWPLVREDRKRASWESVDRWTKGLGVGAARPRGQGQAEGARGGG